MRVGVVDIGSNSVRLLVTDGLQEVGRWVDVTGLGRGVDATGRLSKNAIGVTTAVLEEYGRKMGALGVESRMAIATSASRDAENRDDLFDRAEQALGVRPDLISGAREGALALAGATIDFDLDEPVTVSDIGGGSTELVTRETSVSINVGSVRLTDSHLRRRPSPEAETYAAMEHVRKMFGDVPRRGVASHIGVAGTWTSLAAIVFELAVYDREQVHASTVTLEEVTRLVGWLGAMTVEQTAAIPSLDPKRAPVILAGAVIARVVMETLDVTETVISERDTLDGAALELLAIR